MSSFPLLILWLSGIRGHIPRFDDYRPAAPGTGISHIVRVLVITAAVFAALSFAGWTTVWIAIQVL